VATIPRRLVNAGGRASARPFPVLLPQLTKGFSMIRISLAALLALPLWLTATHPSSAFALANIGLEEVQSDAYRVTAKGSDFRVYEWTPMARPDVVCMAVFSQKGTVGVTCLPKEPGTGVVPH